MTVYEKATAEVVMFEVNDVISTSGGKEIDIIECTAAGGSQTGSTSKECLNGGSIIFKG